MFLLWLSIIFSASNSGSLGQSETCSAIQQFTQGSLFCTSPPQCCTRFLCNIENSLTGPLFASDFQVNPCSSPPSLSAVIEAGGSVLFNQTNISTSQRIPIDYPGRELGSELNLYVNSSSEALTLAVQLGDLELVPETTIPIDTSQCPADSTLPPNLCFPLVPATQPTPSNPLATPSSIPTCLAMQQVVSRDTLLGTTANSCSVSNSCTRLSCTYLGLYPFSVTILPCNTPPAVEFTVSDADGTMLVDETVSRSRTIPLSQLGPESAIYVVLDHPCGRPAIVLEVTFFWYVNSTVIPRTEIPIDQSNCSSVGPSSYPCTTPPAPPSTTCDALLLASRTSGGLCYTDSLSACSSAACDLSSFALPVSYNLTVLPCLDVPGVQFQVANNGSIILDEVLTESKTETVSLGPVDVSLNVIVLQSSDMSSIEVGVDLFIPNPPVSFPVFPRTVIPLDRCACPQINCLTTASPTPVISTNPPTPFPTNLPGSTDTPAATVPPDVSSDSVPKPVTPVEIPVTTGGGVPSSRLTTVETERQTSPDKTTPPQTATNPLTDGGGVVGPQAVGRGTDPDPQATGDNHRDVVAPAVVAGLLFVALLVAVAVAVVIFVIMKKKNNKYKGGSSVSYGLMKANEEASEESI